MSIKCELHDDEAKLAHMLAEVWNEYMKLPAHHPMARQEFCTAIHRCQEMILSRPGQRAINTQGSESAEAPRRDKE